jgi:hypothetical protein
MSGQEFYSILNVYFNINITNQLISKLTKYMELSYSWEASSRSVGKELRKILWNPKVR